MIKTFISRVPSPYRAYHAFLYAAKRGIPGIEFDRFGRKLGLKLAIRGKRGCIGYLLNPVNIVRYFEFPFAFSCISKDCKKCLDISSPRLFSFYVAAKRKDITCHIINPDKVDAFRTAKIASGLKMGNVKVDCMDLLSAAGRKGEYDCIWAISVIEHICGEYDDKAAGSVMYDALKPGGRLILTFPVDRKFWVERRDYNYYGIDKKQGDLKNFFQRVYDKDAIWERLLRPINKEPSLIQWFGETAPGRFLKHQARWMAEGRNFTVNDPKEIADHYKAFPEWEDMPGMGVCGLMIEKTKS